MTGSDTITSDDLPELRAFLIAQVDCATSGAYFRRVCSDAVAAIDVAIAEDAATEAKLSAALERFVRAAKLEVLP